VSTGVKAEKAARAQAEAGQAGGGLQKAKNSGDPEPGNVRRIRERRVQAVVVKKHGQEFWFTNGEGLPVRTKPYEEGVTKVEHPKLGGQAWREYADAVKEGYPDLDTPDRFGNPQGDYANFSDLNKSEFGPGKKLRRVVAHDSRMDSDAWSVLDASVACGRPRIAR
jgi:hypothetical protein